LSQQVIKPSLPSPGFEALDLFRRQPHAFQLVLLDLTMPFMT